MQASHVVLSTPQRVKFGGNKLTFVVFVHTLGISCPAIHATFNSKLNNLIASIIYAILNLYIHICGIKRYIYKKT